MDRREAILARLRVIVEGIEGLAVGRSGQVIGVGRNREDLSATARPAIIVHDGVEDRTGGSGGGPASAVRPPRRSLQQMMTLKPHFEILLGARTEDVGTLASTFRKRLLVAVLNDTELIDLIGGERGAGDMWYEGLEFGSTQGESREARVIVNFALNYPFRLDELAAA